jgi:hypothetical protein
MDLSALFAGLNSLILVGLIYLYGRVAWRSRAAFSVGLLMFAGLLLLHDGMTVYMYLTMSAYFGGGVIPYVFATTALEFAGLLALLRITL